MSKFKTYLPQLPLFDSIALFIQTFWRVNKVYGGKCKKLLNYLTEYI